MNYTRIAAVAALAVGLLGTILSNAASAVAFKATLLHPMGAISSAGTGISGTMQVGVVDWSQLDRHALLWNGSADDFIDLHPPGYVYSHALGVDGDWQVGFGTSPATDNYDEHAVVWNSTAASAVDLHPSPSYQYSFAVAVSGTSQVGNATFSGFTPARAFLWHGTPESAVNLHPLGYAYSAATGVDGASQVGWGETGGSRHALAWSGTAESAIDLHPAGFAVSEAADVSGTQQIGFGRQPAPNSYERALLWSGSAENYVNLHPAGFLSSNGWAITGNSQVGSGLIDTPQGIETHALAWNGTAVSAVDLHQYLSTLPYTFDQSYAVGVNEDGTIVGYAYTYGFDPVTIAILWTPVPEPSTGLLLVFGMSGALLTSRRNRP